MSGKNVGNRVVWVFEKYTFFSWLLLFPQKITAAMKTEALCNGKRCSECVCVCVCWQVNISEEVGPQEIHLAPVTGESLESLLTPQSTDINRHKKLGSSEHWLLNAFIIWAVWAEPTVKKINTFSYYLYHLSAQLIFFWDLSQKTNKKNRITEQHLHLRLPQKHSDLTYQMVNQTSAECF